MGKGHKRAKAGSGKKTKNKWFQKNVMSVKRRTKDIDQIQDEMKALAEGLRTKKEFLDADVAGGGAHYCVPCARHFISAATLEEHSKTKPHKKRVKEVAEPQWNQKEADAAAGMAISS